MASADYVHLDIPCWSKHGEELRKKIDEFINYTDEAGKGKESDTAPKYVDLLGAAVDLMKYALHTVETGIILLMKSVYYDAVTHYILPALDREPRNSDLAAIIRAAMKTIRRIDNQDPDDILMNDLDVLLKLCDNYSS